VEYKTKVCDECGVAKALKCTKTACIFDDCKLATTQNISSVSDVICWFKDAGLTSDPNITETVDGEMCLEWWCGVGADERKLTVYVGSGGVCCIRVWGTCIDSDMDDRLIEKADVPALVAWLEGGAREVGCLSSF
jgi:hypothetical protein